MAGMKDNEVVRILEKWATRVCPVCGEEGMKTPAPTEHSVRICHEHGAYWDVDYLLALKELLVEVGILPLNRQQMTALILALRLLLDFSERYPALSPELCEDYGDEPRMVSREDFELGEASDSESKSKKPKGKGK